MEKGKEKEETRRKTEPEAKRRGGRISAGFRNKLFGKKFHLDLNSDQ